MTAPNPDIVAKLYNLELGVFAGYTGPRNGEALKSMIRRRDGKPVTQEDIEAFGAAGIAELEAVAELHRLTLEQSQYRLDRTSRIRDLAEKYTRPGDTGATTMDTITARMTPDDLAEVNRLWADLGNMMILHGEADQ